MTESDDTMDTTGAGPAEALGILELADVCAAMRARCTHAFEQLGRWVTSDAARTADGRLRRELATAAHRHARHADLWAGRAPTIPVAIAVPPIDRGLATVEGATPDVAVAAYAAWRSALDADLTALAERVDAELDPATVDVVERIRFDLARTVTFGDRPRG